MWKFYVETRTPFTPWSVDKEFDNLQEAVEYNVLNLKKCIQSRISKQWIRSK